MSVHEANETKKNWDITTSQNSAKNNLCNFTNILKFYDDLALYDEPRHRTI